MASRKAKAKSRDDRDTTERLLDTAERLFAEFGFDGVGMRALAEEAGVNLGATTYHYGSKEKLYIETFLRRFRPANERRMELLKLAEQQALKERRKLSVREVVDCMLRPPFMTVLEHPHFPALLARNLFMPPVFLEKAIQQEHDAVMMIFMTTLASRLPGVPPPVFLMRFMFSGGCLIMISSHMSRLNLRENPKACDALLKTLVDFVAAGLSSPSPLSSDECGLLPLPPFMPGGATRRS